MGIPVPVSESASVPVCRACLPRVEGVVFSPEWLGIDLWLPELLYLDGLGANSNAEDACVKREAR